MSKYSTKITFNTNFSHAPSTFSNRYKPNLKRSVNAEQFIFGYHNNYQRPNDFSFDFGCNRIINIEVIKELIWKGCRISPLQSMQQKIISTYK